jgi:antitoxin FitA
MCYHLTMRQLITRIQDDLHARLKAAAAHEGTSMNALVIEALERATGRDLDQRAVVRRRARESGMLVVPPQPDRSTSRHDVIESTRGVGTAVSAALAEERGAS